MNLSIALSISFALGIMMKPGFSFMIPSECSTMVYRGEKSVVATSSTFLQSSRNLGSWDNDDFLSSLSQPPEPSVVEDEIGSDLEDFSKLSVEDQAAMFRQMMLQQPQEEQPLTDYSPPPRGPPTMIGGLDAKGRKIGRNRDTDTIANTSDLYFAQLKRDSSVRNMARMQGDEEYADKVFVDPSVKSLGDELYQNPYLQREKEESLESIQAIAMEMKQLQLRQADVQPDITDMGPKYKAILEAKKKKKISKSEPEVTKQEATVTQTTVLPDPVSASPSAPSSPPAVLPEATNVMETLASTSEPTLRSESSPSVRQSISTASPGFTATVKTTTTTVTSETTIQEEEKGETESTKRQIRELQGLFLKHRGGPGFGSGRLRGKEIDQFETTLRSVGAQLRSEAGPRDQAVGSATKAADSVAIPAAAPPVLNTASQVLNTISDPTPLLTSSTEHKAVPIITPPPRPDTSAMTAFVASSVDPKIQASIACVEGAIQMYKNCDPDLQQGVLMMLRAAFLSAAKTCQNVMEGESSTMYTTTPVSPTSFPSPFTAQDATIEKSGEGTVVVAPIEDTKPSGTDTNTVVLNKVYNSLCAASGDGKYGLGPLSSTEASDLSELVKDMRVILMEELESGIPEETVPSTSSDSAKKKESSGTVLNYQQMLAKARAKKNTSA